jgi:hypothetical protein
MQLKLKPSDPNPRLRRVIYLRYIYWLSNRILKTNPSSLYTHKFSNESLPENNDELSIITVAFNNLNVLQYQYKLLKNIKDKKYTYLIADNSNDREKSKAIADFCKQNNISYIRLPKSRALDSVSGSYSHGAALNWLYYHYILPRKPRYFGFIDHDIYLIKPVEIINKIGNQQFYACRGLQENNTYWLWPGLMFFETSYLQNLPVNFLPCRVDGLYMDTGGSMWCILYSKLDSGNLTFIESESYKLRELGYDNDSIVSFMDDRCWFHSGSAGYRNDNIENYHNIVGDILKVYS